MEAASGREESKPMKNEREKSDPSKVAKRPANKPKVSEVDLWGGWAESAEPREGAEGNTGEQHTCRTPSRESVSQGLERVREFAVKYVRWEPGA
jgi:RNA-directed DNA polymerase